MHDAEPRATIHDSFPLEIPHRPVSWEELGGVIEEFVRPFDLAIPPLFRVMMLQVDDDFHLVLVDVHHIICDGVSAQILVTDITRVYDGDRLDEPAINYCDYARWERESIEKGHFNSHADHWYSALSSPFPYFRSFLGRPWAGGTSLEGEVKSVDLGLELSKQLAAVAAEHKTSHATLLLTALFVLVRELTAHEDIMIGVPLMGRSHPETSGIVGLFAKLVPIRHKVQGEEPFGDLLSGIHEDLILAHNHQDYPQDLLSFLVMKNAQEGAHSPFQIVFDYFTLTDQQAVPEMVSEDLRLRVKQYEARHAWFDLTFYMEEGNTGTRIRCAYRRNGFDGNDIHSLLTNFVGFLHEVVENPRKQLWEYGLVGDRVGAKAAPCESHDGIEITEERMLNLASVNCSTARLRR